MPRPFAAFDVDGTIFKSSLVEKIVSCGIEDGVFPSEPFNEAERLRRQWQDLNTEETYQTYLGRLVTSFIVGVADVEVERFQALAERMIATQRVRRFLFPRHVISLVADTHELIAISGSPLTLVQPFLADLPFAHFYGSAYDIENGRFTGEAQPVENKGAIIQKLIQNKVVSTAGSLADGDTISDRDMLELAETPIMFNASRTLARYGKEKGWLRVLETKDEITALKYDPHARYYREIDITQVYDDLVAA